MNCLFCSEQLCISFSGIYDSHYICKNHKYNVFYLICNNNSKIRYFFDFPYNDRWYVISFRYEFGPKYCDILCQDDLNEIIEFDYIPNLTPENIDEKISALLIFS